MTHIFTDEEYGEHISMKLRFSLLKEFKKELLAKSKSAIDTGKIKCWKESGGYCDECILGVLGIAPRDTDSNGVGICLAGKFMAFSK
jgi:hypothetical protein